jgi:hypothetical protein
LEYIVATVGTEIIVGTLLQVEIKVIIGTLLKQWELRSLLAYSDLNMILNTIVAFDTILACVIPFE